MKLKTLHFRLLRTEGIRRQLKQENIFALLLLQGRIVAETKINEFDRGSINIQLGVNVMAMRAPAVFHYVQKKQINKYNHSLVECQPKTETCFYIFTTCKN